MGSLSSRLSDCLASLDAVCGAQSIKERVFNGCLDESFLTNLRLHQAASTELKCEFVHCDDGGVRTSHAVTGTPILPP